MCVCGGVRGVYVGGVGVCVVCVCVCVCVYSFIFILSSLLYNGKFRNQVTLTLASIQAGLYNISKKARSIIMTFITHTGHCHC